MHFETINGRRYAQFETLRHLPGLVHAYTTRPEDVSPRADSLAAERARHRETALTDWGLDPTALHHCIQVHETNIAIVGTATAGGPLPHCDGAATNVGGAALMTFSADCPLVLLYEPQRRVLGMAHASWRCAVAGIVTRLIDLLRARFDCDPADLRAGIGPGAGPCCYDVRDDVYNAAAVLPNRDLLFTRNADRWRFDLWQASRSQLLAEGIPAEQIELAGLCTL